MIINIGKQKDLTQKICKMMKENKRIKLKIDNEYELLYNSYYETIDLYYNEKSICYLWKNQKPVVEVEEKYNKLNKENNIMIKYITEIINFYNEIENEKYKEIYNNLKNIILENGEIQCQ